MSIVNNRPYL